MLKSQSEELTPRQFFIMARQSGKQMMVYAYMRRYLEMVADGEIKGIAVHHPIRQRPVEGR